MKSVFSTGLVSSKCSSLEACLRRTTSERFMTLLPIRCTTLPTPMTRVCFPEDYLKDGTLGRSDCHPPGGRGSGRYWTAASHCFGGLTVHPYLKGAVP